MTSAEIRDFVEDAQRVVHEQCPNATLTWDTAPGNPGVIVLEVRPQPIRWQSPMAAFTKDELLTAIRAYLLDQRMA